ncbi:MAG: ATP-binding protein [Flavobacteriia bacterium]|nr:ATP-binding protein [Flavobacteriia bacterium]
MIKSIELKDNILKEYHFDDAPFLNELAKINVFIGGNNSGKSRILRYLFADNDKYRYFDYTSYADEKWKLLVNNLIQHTKSALKRVSESDFVEQDKLAILNEIELVVNVSSQVARILRIINLIEHLTPADFSTINRHQSNTVSHSYFQRIMQTIKPYYDQLASKTTSESKLYIPILRGLRPIQHKEGKVFSNFDSFKLRSSIDYFDEIKNDNLNIFSGLTMYDEVMKLLLGSVSDRKLIGDFEDFLAEYVFGENITLIPKYQDDVLHIKIGDEEQLEIYNLGDGLQALISILFPVFIRKDKKMLIFIEEPEAHLHPEWQLKLLSALKSFENHQYFISTHSNAFINDDQASIYHVKREKEFSLIKNSNLEFDKLNIIKNLGYRQSDLLLANFILWVEGPSDKTYFEYWISKIAPELRGGIDYTIMFYGGSTFKYLIEKNQMIDLSFIKKINQNFGIVLDSDRKSKSENHNSNKKEIEKHFLDNGAFCWLTTFREIENYIDYDVFSDAVKAFHKKKNISISSGNFDDRCMVLDNDAKLEFKPKIQIPQEIFKKIQKNKDGTTKGIESNILRNAIENAIQETGKSVFKVDKINVAKVVVDNNPEMSEPELVKKVQELVKKIKNVR